MQKLSVVIVCKNEAAVIRETLESFSGLTDDILVYDNGSTDGTQQVVKEIAARLYEGDWLGFGQTKNKANKLAKYDWILSLDADEAIDEELKRNLLQLDPDDDRVVYELKFKNFLGDKWLRFGEWGNDKHIRLFNKQKVKWNDAKVHEALVLPGNGIVKTISGYVLHKTIKDINEYRQKTERYAVMSAEKYFLQGKKSSLLLAALSAGFSFIKNYIFKLGFLDGKEGLICARMTARYTWLKYKQLIGLNRLPGG